jgi:hypothetical protein
MGHGSTHRAPGGRGPAARRPGASAQLRSGSGSEIRQLKTPYLTDLVPPPPGTVCTADRQPFDPDYGEPLQAPAP